MHKNQKLWRTALAVSVSSALAFPAFVYAQSGISPPVELRLAREELDSARIALGVRDYDQAFRLAEQALVDARVAEARAETESVRQAARDLRMSGETLRAEAARLAAL